MEKKPVVITDQLSEEQREKQTDAEKMEGADERGGGES